MRTKESSDKRHMEGLRRAMALWGGPASRSSGRRGSLPEHWQLLGEGPGSLIGPGPHLQGVLAL